MLVQLAPRSTMAVSTGPEFYHGSPRETCASSRFSNFHAIVVVSMLFSDTPMVLDEEFPRNTWRPGGSRYLIVEDLGRKSHSQYGV